LRSVVPRAIELVNSILLGAPCPWVKDSRATTAGPVALIAVELTTVRSPPPVPFAEIAEPSVPEPFASESATRPPPEIASTPVAFTRRAMAVGADRNRPPVTVVSSTRPAVLITGGGVAVEMTAVGTDTVLRRTVEVAPSCRHVEEIVLDRVESSI